MAIDASSVVVAGIMAVSNLGGMGLLMKWYMRRVDANTDTTQEHAILLERTAQAQKATAETLEKVQESISDLYESRNVAKEDLTKINLLHKLKRCEDSVRDQTFFQGHQGR